MAGQHRARRAFSPLLASLLVVLVIAAGWWGVRLLGNDEADPSSDPTTPGPSSSAPTSPTTPASPTSPTKSSSPTKSPSTQESSPSATSSSSAPVDLPEATPAAPVRLVADGLFDLGFDLATAGTDGVLEAQSPEAPTRLEDRALPGNPTQDSVVVLGDDRYDLVEGAFNRLPDLSAGDEVTITTDSGSVLTYTVQRSLRVAASEVTSAPAVRQRVPGRLVLVGLRYDEDGTRGERDLVVVAQLSAVTP